MGMRAHPDSHAFTEAFAVHAHHERKWKFEMEMEIGKLKLAWHLSATVAVSIFEETFLSALSPTKGAGLATTMYLPSKRATIIRMTFVFV